jgi:hypothetical protein
MNRNATWAGTVAGTIVGTGGWIFGLGDAVWPDHPQWALFFITLMVTLIAVFAVEHQPHPRRTPLR